MNTLAQLLSSRVRAALFQLLFGFGESEYHVRELARRSGLHEATVRQELRKLTRLDLVAQRRDGNRAYYRANRSHPLYAEIHGLVLKTAGLVECFADALKGADIEIAFVFGSVARGTENAESDVDLMVVGDLGLRRLAALLPEVATRLDREINPHVLNKVEYARRVKAGDHFVTRVLDGPKLFIVGNEHDLEALGR